MISFIIPIYNSESTIEKCINSLLRQMKKNDEIILIDDGSDDRSLEICNELKKRNERQINIFHQENSGVSSARNTGLKNAKGKWIQFIDSDDFISEEYYGEVEKVLEAYSEIDLIIFGIQHENEEGIKKYSDIPNEKILFSQKVFLEKFYAYMEKHLINSPCNKLYRLEIINREKIRFDERLSLGEDLIFNLEYISKANKVFSLNKPLYIYKRTNNISLSLRYHENMLSINKHLHKKIRNFLFENKANQQENMIYLEQAYFDYLSSNYRNIFIKNNKLTDKEKRTKINEIFTDDYFNLNNKYKVQNTKSRILYLLTKYKTYTLIKILYSLNRSRLK